MDDALDVFFAVHFQLYLEDALLFAPVYGQHPMRGQGADRFPVAAVHFKGLLQFLFRVVFYRRQEDGALPQDGTEKLAESGIFADCLGDNVGCPGEGVCDAGYTIFFVNVVSGDLVNGSVFSGSPGSKEYFRQRGKSLFPGNRRPGPAFFLVREINILQLLQLCGFFQGGGDFRGQLAKAFDFDPDFLLTGHQIAEVAEALLNGADLGFVQLAGGLLSIAGDEGDRCAAIQQFGGGSDLAGFYGQLLRYYGRYIIYLHNSVLLSLERAC